VAQPIGSDSPRRLDPGPATARVATLVETAGKFGAPGGEVATVVHQSTVTDPAKVNALPLDRLVVSYPKSHRQRTANE
jgi:hypothetical protein